MAALATAFPDDRLELYGHRLRRPRERPTAALPPNARLRSSRVPAGALSLAERAGLGADVLLGAADVVHWTDYVALGTRHAPVVATVHDVCFADLPACYTTAQRAAATVLVRRVADEAARIIVPCDRVVGDLRRHFDVEADRIDVVPHGCRPLPDGPPAVEHGAEYVLCVGTLQPRKNVERLIEAFDAVHAQHPRLKLVLAGPVGWMADGIRVATLARAHVVHEPEADAARLAALYRGALVVAMPSLAEGFGLPVLEAMALGKPVLVGADTACSDLAADAGLAVDATDVDALATGLLTLVADEALRQRLGARGVERAAAFTWERSARLTRAVYAKALQA